MLHELFLEVVSAHAYKTSLNPYLNLHNFLWVSMDCFVGSIDNLIVFRNFQRCRDVPFVIGSVKVHIDTLYASTTVYTWSCNKVTTENQQTIAFKQIEN